MRFYHPGRHPATRVRPFLRSDGTSQATLPEAAMHSQAFSGET